MTTSSSPNGDEIRAAFADLMRRARRSETPEITPRQSLTRHDPTISAHPRRTRGPQKTPTKVQVSIRFDADLVRALRETGKGWQGRANDILRNALALDKDAMGG
ncbi:MAG: BrnA antitoxin family protein [Pseudomonadota bacterium]